MKQEGKTINADTVILNSNIITMDSSNPKAQALAMLHGRLVAVGSNSDISNYVGPETEILELPGKTVLPGFIDAHIHVLNSGIRHVMAADCDLPSIADIQEALKQQANKTPPGEWVQGFKFDDTKTIEGRFLNRTDLDMVSTQHPIMVAHRAGHIYYLNSKALELASFNNDTPDPSGGRLGRLPGSNVLNGVIYERAIEPVRFGLIPPETEEIRREGLKLICQMLNKVGLTSVHDARVTKDEFLTYQNGKEAGDLTLRVYALLYHPHFESARATGLKTGLGDDMLKLGGIKMIADGAIAARTAYMSEPYLGTPCDCDYGILAMDAEETENMVEQIHRAGFQVCIHANGDLAIDMVLKAYEKAQTEYPRVNPRHRIEHCTLVNPDILKRMHDLGVIATPFCTYIYHHGEKMQFFGKDRLEWMFAQRSFIDYGVISTGATDYPPGPYEPLMGIQACVTRTDSNGNLWGGSQKISVEEALKLYTLHGAYASFEEDSKGSLEAGKLADIVVLGDDPLTVDPFSIKDIPVERTILGGKTVFCS